MLPCCKYATPQERQRLRQQDDETFTLHATSSTKEEKTITISVESDGVFSQNLGLQIGTNTIVLLAKDEFGRHSRLLRRVEYNITETKKLV